ncbi:integrase [Pseudomonas sp. Irchel s3b2]|uniref:integrase n=1 Tax=Pseudomonas sp. Irchel s3b2 TaxID=2009073 RepID=UPI000BA4BBF7|nr:integrase [Pseudomonas sp. Irchel s3b2]
MNSTVQIINNQPQDAYLGIPLSEITPLTVISRNSKDEPLSVVSDNLWKLPQIKGHARSGDKINFSKFAAFNQIDETNLYTTKLLMIVMIFRPSKRTGTYPSHDKVALALTGIYKLYCHAQAHNITLDAMLNDHVQMVKFISASNSLNYLRNIQAIFNRIIAENFFTISPKIMRIFERAIKEANDESEQHPVIPGAILLKKTTNYINTIKEYNKNMTGIELLVERVSKNPCYGRMKRKPRNANECRVSFETAMHECGLNELMKTNDMKQISSLCNFIKCCYYAAKMLIHIYTAMRETEAYLLEEGCVDRLTKTAYIVKGLTVKLTKEPRPANWITSKEILLPYNLAINITKMVKKFGPDHIKSSKLLFLSATYLPISNQYKRIIKSKKLTQASLTPFILEKYFPQSVITERDFEELLMLDPLREWQSQENFQPGQIWHLTTHQFRRSMAVYAAQSGLVSLPSLKRMLQHTLLQMSLYYVKGFATAKYLFNVDNPDVVAFFKTQQPNAEASLFLKDVILEETKLHGAAGIWSDRNRKTNYLANIRTSFADTLDKVKRGLMSYKETILGGCMKVGECYERAHHNFVACLTCVGACIKESKLDTTISSQTQVIKSLEEGTFAYNTEMIKLEMLFTFKNKILETA